jgi:hypothetical protein
VKSDRTLIFKFPPEEQQVTVLSHVLYDQLLYGRFSLGAFSPKEKDDFVRYGFARYVNHGKDVTFDEPIVILAVYHWLVLKGKFSLYECALHNLSNHASRQNGFEAFLVLYMRLVFETSPVLSEIFTFRSDFARRVTTDLAWQNEPFELVTVAKGQDNTHNICVVTPFSGPSSVWGFTADSGKDVVEWLSTNTRGAAFCYPPPSLGPDLLFFIRSTVSGGLVLVAVQARRRVSIKYDELLKGVRTLTPCWFWKSKDLKVRPSLTPCLCMFNNMMFVLQHLTPDKSHFLSNDGAEIVRDINLALENIPCGLKAADACYPVLRVFASWPGDARLDRMLVKSLLGGSFEADAQDASEQQGGGTCEDILLADLEQPLDNGALIGSDSDSHPLAGLHLSNFIETGKHLDKNWFLGVVVPSKRMFMESDSESCYDSKRLKTDY